MSRSRRDAAGEAKPIGLHMGLMARLRAYFFAGVLITAPISITFYIAWIIVTFIDDRVTRMIPAAYNPNTYLHFSIPGIGLVIVIVGLTLIGGLTAGILGRFLVRVSEGVLHRMPVIRSIYSAVKQIFETILADRATAFRQVVLVQFPRLGLWRIGFVTSNTPPETKVAVGAELVSVYIPNTPNATAGFLVLVPQNELVAVDLTVEEAMKLVVSAGIATPGQRGNDRPISFNPNGEA